MMRKIITTLVIGGAVLFAWRYYHRPKPTEYQTAAVERRDIVATVSATGNISPIETVQVGSQVSGTVKAVYVTYNSKVRRGQILALIDPGPFEAQLQQAQASLDSAKAAAAAAQATLAEAKIGVEAARRQSDSQQSLAKSAAVAEDLADLQLEHDRAQEKIGQQTVDTVRTAQTNRDLALDDLKVAEGQVRTAGLSISEKEAEVEQAQVQLDAAQAQVEGNQAAVDLAKINLAHTEITAPIDGTVLSRSVSGGETVAASAVAPELFELTTDAGQMQVDVDLDESDVGRVKAGQDASFTVDAYPGRTFRATVRQVRKDAINVQNVITYDVVMDIVKPPVSLLPGMTASVTIEVAARHGVLAVPNAALRFEPDPEQRPKGGQIYELAGNRPVAKRVATGITDGRYTELLPGDLKEGDQVVESLRQIS